MVRRPGDALPFQFMDNFIEEPLICRRTRRISGRLFRPIISAYYFWLFPNLMFNFYPWGLSLNIVRPLQPDRPKVSFRAYIFDESKLHAGAGADVDLVEREDEAVVEQVQLGTRSRFYRQGRFSPNMEQGVHQFHQLVAGLLG